MRGRGKTKTKRLVISEPIGPIKTSRGADFIRSDTLIIVDAIKDCESNTSGSTPDKHVLSAVSIQQTSRRVSAGFQTDGPLVSSPTVASSGVTATPTIEAPSSCSPKRSKKPRRSLLPSSSSSIPRRPFKTISTTALLPRPSTTTIRQDENVPPSSFDYFICLDPPALAPPPVSKLPKSRTMNALHELKTSISRPSLAVRSINSVSFSGSSRKTSSSSTATWVFPSSSSKLRLPRSSMTSLGRSSRSCTPEPQPLQVSTAQSSAYWSGRFMALHDKFSSENLALDASRSSNGTNRQSASPFNAPARTPYSTLYQRSSHLPHSTTTSALRTLTTAPAPPAISDDDTRCRRIFAHLDSLCITSDARRSLHVWQQAYARRHGRPCLLPEGGSMENKGFMAKIFGGAASRKSERRSFGALRQVSHNRGGKNILSDTTTSMTGSSSNAPRGKRLTLS